MADDRYTTDYQVGQDNVEKFGMDIHHPVFAIAAALILVFVIGTLIFPESSKVAFDGSKAWSIDNFDWLFMVAGNIFVLFVHCPDLPAGGQDPPGRRGRAARVLHPVLVRACCSRPAWASA
jgi:hypothetical protein